MGERGTKKMFNPIDLILGLVKSLKIRYKEKVESSLWLQAIKLFIDMLKGKQV